MEETQNSSVKLMTLLDKMVKPVENCIINLEVGGVFAFPEEWKAADDANPNFFTYKVNFMGIDVTEGKIVARELTEQEKKEIEEAQAAKKKPPPKDNKKNPPPEVPQLSPEELERQQKLEEERLEAERKAKEEWDALSEQEKFYRTYEDKYKKDSLKWEHNQKFIEKDGEDLVIFEEKVALGGAWLYFTKQSTATEEEMVKLRKSKPKNLNLIDLNPCTMKAWVDLAHFQTPGVNELVYRAKVEKHYNPEDKPEELPNPKLENTYILVKITLDPPITPLIHDVQPRVEDMVPKPFPIPKLSASVEVVNEFKSQLAIIMESLAMEYSVMFGKEMNVAQEPKPRLHPSNQQKRDIREQRKEKFLYDFNTSGKYNILKEKMKKILMKIVRDKFQKTGSLTGVTTKADDQFYSELYIFLTEQMRQTLNDLTQEKKDELHDELVVSVNQSNKERDTVINTITKENGVDKELRLAVENEIVHNLPESEKAYKNLLATDRENHRNAYMYCQFLIKKRKNFAKAEEVLNEALRYNNENRAYITLLACLLARRGRKRESIVCLNTLLDRDPYDSLTNTLVSFVYGKLANETKLGRKFFAISQRALMRKLGLLAPKPAPQSMVMDQQGPTSMANVPQVPDDSLSKKIVLTDDQNDQIWVEVAEYLVKNGIYDLAEQVIDEIKNKSTEKVEFFRAQMSFLKGDMLTCLEILNRLIQNDPKNSEYLLTKANYCFEKEKYHEAEDVFLRAFKLKTTEKSFENFLRLGYTFLYKKAWGDARATLTKACEMKANSSLAWLGLGIACLRTGEYAEGEQALTQANIYDPLNAEVWGYLALLCLYDGGRIVQAHQALREMLKCELKNAGLLIELADQLVIHGKLDVAEALYKRLLDNWQGSSIGTNEDIGNLHSKLGKIYHTQDKLMDAKLYYAEALKYLEGEAERERVEMMLNDINKATLETGF